MRGVQRAWREAEGVLARFEIASAPVDIQWIAREYAHVIERDLDDDISGVLVPIPEGGWAILVNACHSEARRRFTLAHELGHLVLHGYKTPHADRGFKFRDARSSEGSALEEIQANQFAAELLMPRALVMQAVQSYPLDHAFDEGDEAFAQLTAELASRFGVSKQAMTIRISSLFA